jgi:hypothetical protein
MTYYNSLDEFVKAAENLYLSDPAKVGVRGWLYHVVGTSTLRNNAC